MLPDSVGLAMEPDSVGLEIWSTRCVTVGARILSNIREKRIA